MKLLHCLLAFSLVGFSAAEVVTLTAAKQSLTVDPGDVVEVVSVIGDSTGNYPPRWVRFSMAEGESTPTVGFDAVSPPPMVRLTMTGVTAVSLSASDSAQVALPAESAFALTLRISKQAEQVVSEPVVLPAVTDENYTVELQTSTNLANWIPAVPGDYLGGSTNRFFRVKVEAKSE